MNHAKERNVKVLQQVLRELEATQGPVSLSDLARKLDIERNALKGMIEFWVRKGRLKDDAQEAKVIYGLCSGAICGESCSTSQKCHIVTAGPRTFSLVLHNQD